MLQEYFQPKIGRKIGIFNLGRKNKILDHELETTRNDMIFLHRVVLVSNIKQR